MGTFANSEDPDEMQHDAAFHQGLHCMLRLRHPSGKEKHQNFENFTLAVPYLLIVCVRKSIRI